MKVVQETDSRLVIVHRPWRNYIITAVCVLLAVWPSIMSFEAMQTITIVGWLARIAHFIVFCFFGVVSAGEVSTCDIDKDTVEVRIQRRTLTDQRVYVHNLSELVDIMEEPSTERKTAYRVALVFKDGIEMPLTNSFFYDRVWVRRIANVLRKFFGFEQASLDELKKSKQSTSAQSKSTSPKQRTSKRKTK